MSSSSQPVTAARKLHVSSYPPAVHLSSGTTAVLRPCDGLPDLRVLRWVSRQRP